MSKNRKKKTKEGVKALGALWTFQRHVHDTCGCQGMDEACTQGRLVEHKEKHNVVPDVFLEAIAMQCVDAQTYDLGSVLYIAIGTDATAPTEGDTTLGAEEQRKIVGSQAATGNEFNVTVFFNAGEVAGNTYEEYGYFTSGGSSQATASADTGILGSHVIDTMIVGALETLTVSFDFTLSQ